MSLFGLLDIGAGALLAQTAGVATATRNATNANVEGYSRERLDLRSERAAPLVGGVTTSGLSRAQSDILSRRERTVDGLYASASELASALSDLEIRLSAPDGNLVDAIAALFGGISELASAPTDDNLRRMLLSQASHLSSAFQRAAGSIEETQSDADLRIAGYAETASDYARKIALANHALALEKDPVLADQRDLAARKLSELVGGSARIDPDGHMRFVLDGGAVLVDGDRAARVVTTPDAALGGHLRVDVVDGVHVTDVTRKMGSGNIQAALEVRDRIGAAALVELDSLAFDLATRVNAIHRTFAGLDGVSGRDFFREPAVVLGAASGFSLAIGDPSQIASRSPGAGPGDASGVLGMLGLRDSAAAGGGSRSFTEEAIRMIGEVGGATARAKTSLDVAEARASALGNLRNSLSGVSIEEELASLAKFQHAHEASARFIGTVDGLIGHLIETL